MKEHFVVIHDDPQWESEIEAAIVELIRTEIYAPLALIIEGDRRLENKTDGKDPLAQAIAGARISFYRGLFRGKFNAGVTKRLRELGAKWDRKQRGFRLLSSKLPAVLKQVISTSLSEWDRKAQAIDQRLGQILPEELAEKLSIKRILDTAFFKVDKKIEGSLSVAPQLTDEMRARLSSEYQKNYQIKIQDFTRREIVKLRKQVQASAFAGNRAESLAKSIQQSYGVSAARAKFIARQETQLVMTKYKEVRWKAAGVTTYEWRCAAGSPGHPVRAMHKKLEGQRFSWDKPPVVNIKGDRKNPGEDFGCRCFPRAIVKFDE